MSKDGNPRDILLLSHILAVVLSIPFIFLYPPNLTVSNILPILFMGIVQQGVASLFIAYGIRRITAIRAMLTATIEPLCNPVWVLLIVGERPSFSAIIGGAIILFAVAASSIIGKQREAASLRAAVEKRKRDLQTY
jgi:drug/metabolite transporter (DMT)-like permease